MRLIQAFLLLLLAIGAPLPACAQSACDPAPAAATAAHHHGTGMPEAPSPDPRDRHAIACIGCIARLPDMAAPAPSVRVVALAPVASRPAPLRGRTPGSPAPPPRCPA